MKKNLLILFLMIYFTPNINAQDFCGTTDNYDDERNSCERFTPKNWNDTLLLLTNYIPNNDTFPIITIKINAHIWRKDDGTGNRWLDTEEYRDSLRMIIDYANSIAANNQPYSEVIPNAEFISDTKYRLVLDSVYYYNDTYLANRSSNTELNRYLKANYPERLDNFALHMNICNSCYYSGISTSIGGEIQSVLLVKCYSGRYSGLYADAQLLIHEIGHNLGLRHPYDSEYINITHPEFLWDLFGKTQQTWCDKSDTNEVCYHDYDWDCEVSDSTNTCTNNIMGGTKYGRHYTALQCGRIHRALRFANIRKHAYGYTNIPLVINRNQLWDFTYKSYQDIIIEENTTLTVSCRLEMVSQSKIIIKPGGKLIVDGGTITNAHHEGKWQGIEVWGIDSLHQQQVNGQYIQGRLELKNGAVIENAVCAVELCNSLDDHSEGGIVHATDAIFRNNAKAIHACNYANYNPATNFEVDYNSSFNNCSFVIDSNYVGEELFLRHIELINVSSFKFHGCSFSVDKSVPQVSLRPYGIVANNSGLSLSYYIPEGELPLPGGNFARNSFDGFETGIYVTNSIQYSRTVSVEYSDFLDNAKGILIQNTGYATIKDNTFSVGSDEDCSFGLYLDRVSYFDVEDNIFIGNANYGSDNYGVMVRNSASYNDITRNTFRNLQCGNVSLGKNYVTGTNVGLTYTCNTNINNVNDFCIFKEDGIGGISSHQGSLIDPAGNTFSGSNYHICNDGENTISYYYQANNNLQRPVASKLYNVNAVGSSNISSCGIGNIPVIDIMSIDDIVTLENAYNTTLAAYNALLQINSQSAETNEDVEAQLLQLKTEYLNTVGEIVKFYLQQEEKDYEELREWLVKSEDIFSDRMLVASFIQEGNYDDAMTYATMLPKIHDLKDEELQDHNDYIKLIDLYIDLHETDRSANQLTDAELTMVRNIADNGIGTSQMMAESILLAMGEPSLKVPQCLTMPPAMIIIPTTRGAEQSYVPFPTENAQWSVCDDKYSLHGDTIIDGIRYSKVYKQTSDSAFEFDINKAEYFCAIRNDEENKRVYGIYRNTLPVINANGVEIDYPTKEMLLYDFSLNIGDTVSVVNFDEADEAGYISYVEFVRVEVLDVYIYDGNGSYDLLNLHDNDSLVTLENGELRRRMLLNTTGGSVRQYWIEGIGSNEGPFVHDMYGFLEYPPKRLLCYKENDDYLYYQDEFDVDGDVDCFSSKYYANDIRENGINQISVFPNPANDNITISLTGSYSAIEIYDSFGRMMMSRQVNETTGQQVIDVDISSYPSGLYLVIVKKDNERYYKRIVKN